MLIVGASEGARVLALARDVPGDGLVICIEGDRRAAARAAEAFRLEGLGARVNVMIGDPALFLRKVAGPFDLIAEPADLPARLAGPLRAKLAAGGRILDL